MSRLHISKLALLLLVGPTFALGACHSSPPRTAVSGTLLVVGGPAPGAPRPTAGAVQVESTGGGNQTTVDADASGAFTVDLAPGSYVLHGRVGNVTCAPVTVVVSDSVVHPTVTCDIR